MTVVKPEIVALSELPEGQALTPLQRRMMAAGLDPEQLGVLPEVPSRMRKRVKVRDEVAERIVAIGLDVTIPVEERREALREAGLRVLGVNMLYAGTAGKQIYAATELLDRMGLPKERHVKQTTVRVEAEDFRRALIERVRAVRGGDAAEVVGDRCRVAGEPVGAGAGGSGELGGAGKLVGAGKPGAAGELGGVGDAV